MAVWFSLRQLCHVLYVLLSCVGHYEAVLVVVVVVVGHCILCLSPINYLVNQTNEKVATSALCIVVMGH